MADENEGKSHVSIVVAGHVDAGKSSLTGRLLYDLGGINDRDMEKLRKIAEENGKPIIAYHLPAFVCHHLEATATSFCDAPLNALDAHPRTTDNVSLSVLPALSAAGFTVPRTTPTQGAAVCDVCAPNAPGLRSPTEFPPVHDSHAPEGLPSRPDHTSAHGPPVLIAEVVPSDVCGSNRGRRAASSTSSRGRAQGRSSSASGRPAKDPSSSSAARSKSARKDGTHARTTKADPLPSIEILPKVVFPRFPNLPHRMSLAFDVSLSYYTKKGPISARTDNLVWQMMLTTLEAKLQTFHTRLALIADVFYERKCILTTDCLRSMMDRPAFIHNLHLCFALECPRNFIEKSERDSHYRQAHPGLPNVVASTAVCPGLPNLGATCSLSAVMSMLSNLHLVGQGPPSPVFTAATRRPCRAAAVDLIRSLSLWRDGDYSVPHSPTDVLRDVTLCHNLEPLGDSESSHIAIKVHSQYGAPVSLELAMRYQAAELAQSMKDCYVVRLLCDVGRMAPNFWEEPTPSNPRTLQPPRPSDRIQNTSQSGILGPDSLTPFVLQLGAQSRLMTIRSMILSRDGHAVCVSCVDGCWTAVDGDRSHPIAAKDINLRYALLLLVTSENLSNDADQLVPEMERCVGDLPSIPKSAGRAQSAAPVNDPRVPSVNDARANSHASRARSHTGARAQSVGTIGAEQETDGRDSPVVSPPEDLRSSSGDAVTGHLVDDPFVHLRDIANREAPIQRRCRVLPFPVPPLPEVPYPITPYFHRYVNKWRLKRGKRVADALLLILHRCPSRSTSNKAIHHYFKWLSRNPSERPPRVEWATRPPKRPVLDTEAAVPMPIVMQINCAYLSQLNAANIADTVLTNKVNLVALQETRALDPVAIATLAAAGITGCFDWRENEHGGGTAFLAVAPWRVVRHGPPVTPVFPPTNEYTHVKVIPPGMDDSAIIAGSIYLSNSSLGKRTPEQYTESLTCICPRTGNRRPLDIVAGDFNTIPTARSEFLSIAADLGLKIAAPNTPTRGTKVIDYFLFRSTVFVPKPTTLVLDNPISDHHPVMAPVYVGHIPLYPDSAPKTSIRWGSVSALHWKKFSSTVEASLGNQSCIGSADTIHKSIAMAIRKGYSQLPRTRRRAVFVKQADWILPPDTAEKLRTLCPYKLWRLFERPPAIAPPPVEALREAFAAASRSTPAPVALPPPPDPPPPDVTIDEIKAAISQVGTSKSADIDGFHAIAFRHLPDAVLPFLARVASLANLGDVPRRWKLSDIVPVPKADKPDYTSSSSWRQVSLTSLVGKTCWERTLLPRLNPSLAILAPGIQYGFATKRSAEQLLDRLQVEMDVALKSTEKVYEKSFLHNKSTKKTPLAYNHYNDHVVAITLDAKGAFNAAAIEKLVQATPPQYRRAIAAWLGTQSAPRYQRIRGDTIWVITTSGVPQGSVLGPILWRFLLDPILERHSKYPSFGLPFKRRGSKAYADDVILWMSGTFPKETGAALVKWTDILVTELLEVGVIIGPKSSLHILATHPDTTFRRTEDGTVTLKFKFGSLTSVKTPLRFLGFSISLDGSLNSQNDLAYDKAQPLVARLCSLSDIRKASDLRILYYTFIMPHLTRGTTPTPVHRLEILHRLAASAIGGTARCATNKLKLREAGLIPLTLIADRLRNRRMAIHQRLTSIRPNQLPLLLSLPYLSHLTEHHNILFLTETQCRRTDSVQKRRADNEDRVQKAMIILSLTSDSPPTICASDGGCRHVNKIWCGAGSAVVFEPDSMIISREAAHPAGSGSCSYTCECLGAHLCLKLILTMDPVPTHVLWKVDSRGLLESLKRGPLRPTDRNEALLWELLLEIQSKGTTLVAVWIYSHVDDPHNTVADELASTCLDVGKVDPLIKIWWADEARVATSAKRSAYLGKPDPYNPATFGPQENDERLVFDPDDDSNPDDPDPPMSENWYSKTLHKPLTAEPVMHSALANQHPALQRLAARLRSGVWGPLGVSNTSLRQCPACQFPVGERRIGILHMFTCFAALIELDIANPPLYSDLWGTIAKCKSALEYVLLFKRTFLTN